MGAPGLQARPRSCQGRARALPLPLGLGLVLFLCCLLSLPRPTPAPPSHATDSFVTNCTQISDPPAPPNAFLKWSSPATWTSFGFTGVPGTGSLVNVNVTIPCGVAILLDVPMLNLTVLEVQGFLKVNDPVPSIEYKVFACLVLVEGQLSIGTPTAHFKSKITFTLLPNPNNRLVWTANFVWPAEPAFPRTVGHKAFAVMGGQVHLHGMPAGPATPSWIKLNASVRAGDFQIIVDKNVSQLWPIGARIAVASTDYGPDKAEEFGITGYDSDPRGTIITLDNRAVYNHYGDPFGIPDGFGGFIDERAEVALLTRNIVITGLDEPGDHLLEGGHFIIYQTAVPQFIEGVEYFLMGQQGNLGRYNIHFHVCGDTGGLSVVRKNAIHNSKQRCVVVHGTHNVTVDSNVAYNTSGHCFMVEEGGEMNNTFINNLGFLQRAVSVLIASDESDTSPATFWITNMLNNYINNVAGGSDDAGFWTELRGSVRGMSLSIPRLNGIIPQWTPFGNIRGNVAHSNRGPGWRFYPHGVSPHAIYDWNMTTTSQWTWPTQDGYIYDLRTYKHSYSGVFMHNSANVFLVNMTSSDNDWGIEFNSNFRAGVMSSKFLALSNNAGTPNIGWCQSSDPNVPMQCAPVTGCNLTSNSSNWRNRNWDHWQNPMFGIIMDSPSTGTNGRSVYNVSFNRFSGYEQTCGRVSAAIGTGITGMSRQWWSANQAVQGLKSSNPAAPTFWFTPQNFTWPATNSPPTVNGYWDAQTNFAVWDKDGSLVGGTGGFLLANNPGLLPPLGRFTCTPKPDLNAFACPNTCYRSIQFQYNEDGYFPLPNPSTMSRSRGDFSFIVIRRVEDNVTHILDGNANDTSNSGTWRSFWVNVFAPATYEVSIQPPYKNPTWYPANLTINYDDDGGCGAPVTLRILAIPSAQWAIDTTDAQYWSQCSGVTFANKSTPWPVQFQYVCHRNKQVLQLTMLGNMDPNSNIFLVGRGRVLPCRLPMRCGVWSSSDWYFYNTSSTDLRPPKPGAMGYTVPGYSQPGWAYGQAIIGNSGWGWSAVRSLTPGFNSTNGYAFYARKSFTVANTACYAGLFLDFIPLNGLLVFLNNVEVFRWNLPDGNITNATISLNGPPWPNPWMNTSFINITATNASFVEGTNYLAFEFHSTSTWGSSPYFDTRLSLLSNSLACTGASIMPEVCDGVDNNFDGLVDVDPATGKVFTRPCWTNCGMGIETCIAGAFQNCTAPPSLPETCNGKDDNCDGLIDNGVVGTQLDCTNGNVCFQGQCLPQGPLTVPQTVFNRSAPGWWYLDQGWAWQTYSNWTNARFSSNPSDTTIRLPFKEGVAPFGTSAYLGPINTTINQNKNGDIYYFFLKNFTLTDTDAANTYSLSVNVKRDTGAIVWSNGAEIMRSNFPATWNPALNTATYPIQSNNCPPCFWPNSATRSTGVLSGAAKSGTNWLAVQVAQTQWAGSNVYFDLELIRNVNQSCAALLGSPSACVRNPPNDTIFFNFGDTWKYVDASLPLPSFSWILPSFDDSAWPSGPAPLGVQSWTSTRLNMNQTTRQAYYFRKTFAVSDATCHYSALFQLKALDGAVVFVNGVEAFRFQWQGPWVLPTSFSSVNWPRTDRQNFTLSTGWLVNGPNTIAAEIHPSATGANNWYFDLSVSGQREGVNCLPLPP